MDQSVRLRIGRLEVRILSSTLMAGHHKWSELRDRDMTPERRARIEAIRAEMEEQDRQEQQRQTDESLTEIHRLADESGMDL